MSQENVGVVRRAACPGPLRGCTFVARRLATRRTRIDRLAAVLSVAGTAPARSRRRQDAKGAVMSRAVRVLGFAVALVALSAVVAGSVAAKPAGSGPGNSPNAKLCQKGGWQSLVRSNGTSFASEEECTAYAAQGGTLRPKPTYPQAQALCESYGGTFGVGGPDLVQAGAPGALVVWVCNGVPLVDVATTAARQAALTTQCRADNNGVGVVAIRNGDNFTCYDRGGD
jgi:hypothetical protein